MRYFRPKSLTWWSGIASVLVGLASLAVPESDTLGALGRLVLEITGGEDGSPTGMILLGLGLIGIRDKLERTLGAEEGGEDVRFDPGRFEEDIRKAQRDTVANRIHEMVEANAHRTIDSDLERVERVLTEGWRS